MVEKARDQAVRRWCFTSFATWMLSAISKTLSISGFSLLFCQKVVVVSGPFLRPLTISRTSRRLHLPTQNVCYHVIARKRPWRLYIVIIPLSCDQRAGAMTNTFFIVCSKVLGPYNILNPNLSISLLTIICWKCPTFRLFVSLFLNPLHSEQERTETQICWISSRCLTLLECPLGRLFHGKVLIMSNIISVLRTRSWRLREV